MVELHLCQDIWANCPKWLHRILHVLKHLLFLLQASSLIIFSPKTIYFLGLFIFIYINIKCWIRHFFNWLQSLVFLLFVTRGFTIHSKLTIAFNFIDTSHSFIVLSCLLFFNFFGAIALFFIASFGLLIMFKFLIKSLDF